MVRRKLIAAREDLAKRIIKIAERRRLTFYWLVNETLEQAVRAEDMGTTPKEIVDEHTVLEAAKKAGLILTVESLLYDVVERAFRASKREITEKWYETGR